MRNDFEYINFVLKISDQNINELKFASKMKLSTFLRTSSNKTVQLIPTDSEKCQKNRQAIKNPKVNA